MLMALSFHKGKWYSVNIKCSLPEAILIDCEIHMQNSILICISHLQMNQSGLVV